jgi:hypothetical protein
MGRWGDAGRAIDGESSLLVSLPPYPFVFEMMTRGRGDAVKRGEQLMVNLSLSPCPLVLLPPLSPNPYAN